MEGRWVHDLPHGEVRVRVGLRGCHDKAGETDEVQAWKVESV